MFVISFWRGMRHSLVAGHFHPLSTASSDTVIFTMCPSYKLTSFPSHMDTYPASGNLPPLTRDFSARAGTMSIVRAGLYTLWWRLATFDPAAGCPSSSANTFSGSSSVMMNWSPIFPALDVHAVSQAADGMVPYSTPFFACSSVSELGEDGLRLVIGEQLQ